MEAFLATVTSVTERPSSSVPRVNLFVLSCFAHYRAALEIPRRMWSSAAPVCPFSVVLLQVTWSGDPEHSGSSSSGVEVFLAVSVCPGCAVEASEALHS